MHTCRDAKRKLTITLLLGYLVTNTSSCSFHVFLEHIINRTAWKNKGKLYANEFSDSSSSPLGDGTCRLQRCSSTGGGCKCGGAAAANNSEEEQSWKRLPKQAKRYGANMIKNTMEEEQKQKQQDEDEEEMRT